MVREQNFLIKVLRKTKQNVKYNVKISTQSHVLEYNILSKNKKKVSSAYAKRIWFQLYSEDMYS